MHDQILAWYRTHARALPWRAPNASPWGVLVSEVMLQQTPVRRVEPIWRAWMERWPTPPGLAAEEPGTVIRAWGRLGYPRRALRLHAAAAAIADRHAGVVPAAHAELLALPGVGEYTAAAVCAFAFGQRHAVLDTNVRRVLARTEQGAQHPGPATTAAERQLAMALMPADEAAAAQWAAAVMELGALVCTARSPRCTDCPVAATCAWRRAGFPTSNDANRRTQAWEGTDRQARGQLLAALRDAQQPVTKDVLDQAWPDHPAQRGRALTSLIADALVEPLDDGTFSLPTRRQA